MNSVLHRSLRLPLVVLFGMTGVINVMGADAPSNPGGQTRLGTAIKAMQSGDKDAARKDLLELAEEGSMAKYYLGYMYQNGIGCKKDPKVAIDWYKKASDDEIIEAQNALAQMYRVGEGTKKDINKAIQSYLKAANKDNWAAQANLGRIYANGEGTPKDLILAFQWLSMADRSSESGPDVGALAANVLSQMTPLQIQISKTLIHQCLEDHANSSKQD